MIDCEKLTRFVKEVMMSAGLPEETADVFADALVFADMRGVGSHGVTRLAIYYQRILEGQVDPAAVPEILSEYPSMLHIDVKNGMGAPAALSAMKKCVEKARVTGACFAAMKGGNHFGCAGYFTKYAAEHGDRVCR